LPRFSLSFFFFFFFPPGLNVLIRFLAECSLSLVECDASLNALLHKYRGMWWIRCSFRGIGEVFLPVEGDREACPFKGARAAADPYRKDPLSLSPETSLLWTSAHCLALAPESHSYMGAELLLMENDVRSPLSPKTTEKRGRTKRKRQAVSSRPKENTSLLPPTPLSVTRPSLLPVPCIPIGSVAVLSSVLARLWRRYLRLHPASHPHGTHAVQNRMGTPLICE